MNPMAVGILHPGAMGASLAANITDSVVWASHGRSATTARRAEIAGIEDVGALESMVARADVIIAVCPPSAAQDVAASVTAAGFDGVYLDANAVSPATVAELSGVFPRFVDGGIVGPPPEPDGPGTRLYLSGAEAAYVGSLFEGSRVEARVVDDKPGTASALKMAYAGWTKGSSALLLALAAYASDVGVLRHLITEWEESIPDLPDRLDRVSAGVGRKAWRFEGEMEEVASSLFASGLPDGFHRAAAEIYSRLAELKDRKARDDQDKILDLLLSVGLDVT